MRSVTLTFVLLGIATVLMVPFDGPVIRTVGVLVLFAFIVQGTIALASPERIEREPDGSG